MQNFFETDSFQLLLEIKTIAEAIKLLIKIGFCGSYKQTLYGNQVKNLKNQKWSI